MKRNHIIFLLIPLVFAAVNVRAGELNLPNQFTEGSPAVAAEVNDNFTAVTEAVNDNNSRIKALAVQSQVSSAQYSNVVGTLTTAGYKSADLYGYDVDFDVTPPSPGCGGHCLSEVNYRFSVVAVNGDAVAELLATTVQGNTLIPSVTLVTGDFTIKLAHVIISVRMFGREFALPSANIPSSTAPDLVEIILERPPSTIVQPNVNPTISITDGSGTKMAWDVRTNVFQECTTPVPLKYAVTRGVTLDPHFNNYVEAYRYQLQVINNGSRPISGPVTVSSSSFVDGNDVCLLGATLMGRNLGDVEIADLDPGKAAPSTKKVLTLSDAVAVRFHLYNSLTGTPVLDTDYDYRIAEQKFGVGLPTVTWDVTTW